MPRRSLSPSVLMAAHTDDVSMHKEWTAQESVIAVCTQSSGIDVSCTAYSGH